MRFAIAWKETKYIACPQTHASRHLTSSKIWNISPSPPPRIVGKRMIVFRSYYSVLLFAFAPAVSSLNYVGTKVAITSSFRVLQSSPFLHSCLLLTAQLQPVKASRQPVWQLSDSLQAHTRQTNIGKLLTRAHTPLHSRTCVRLCLFRLK